MGGRTKRSVQSINVTMYMGGPVVGETYCGEKAGAAEVEYRGCNARGRTANQIHAGVRLHIA